MGQLEPVVARREEGRDVYVSRREPDGRWSVQRSSGVRGAGGVGLDGSPVADLAAADALIDQDVARRGALVSLWSVFPLRAMEKRPVRWVTGVTVLEPGSAIRLGSSLLEGRESFDGSGEIVGTSDSFEDARALVPVTAVEITPPDYGGEGVQLLATVGVAPGRR